MSVGFDFAATAKKRRRGGLGRRDGDGGGAGSLSRQSRSSSTGCFICCACRSRSPAAPSSSRRRATIPAAGAEGEHVMTACPPCGTDKVVSVGAFDPASRAVATASPTSPIAAWRSPRRGGRSSQPRRAAGSRRFPAQALPRRMSRAWRRCGGRRSGSRSCRRRRRWCAASSWKARRRKGFRPPSIPAIGARAGLSRQQDGLSVPPAGTPPSERRSWIRPTRASCSPPTVCATGRGSRTDLAGHRRGHARDGRETGDFASRVTLWSRLEGLNVSRGSPAVATRSPEVESVGRSNCSAFA